MEKKRGENISPRYSTLTMHPWTTCIVGWLIIHGVTSFNYDYSSSCTRPYRSARAHAPVSVPCDLNKQSYCNLPGAGYPWHAVRRFVHENQGLMRRMYGDQRHISVLKAEIETNDIDSESEYDTPNRDESFARSSKDHDIINTKQLYSKRPTSRTSESYTAPHFRPVQTTPTSTKLKATKEKEKHTPAQKKEEIKTILIEKSTKESIKLKEELEKIKLSSYKTSILEDEINLNVEPNGSLETNKLEPEIISLQAAIKQSIETNSVYPNYGAAPKNVTIITSTSTSTSTPTADSKSSPIDTTTSNYVTSQETTLPQDYDADMTPSDTEEENGGWKPVAMDKMSTLPPTMLFSESVKNEKISIDRTEDLKSEASENKKAEPTGATSSVLTTNMEGQLFQDVVPEEPKPIVKLRGVNACPVKEEVVAPFWANNTRGEVLALLNLYPFEQYVHWEKCTNEYKQMFCRDGCRCEQQYRLHRLLAYDPNNECRGIFSDWFRFPSCCVCKCYNMPLEFRVTSRSPRSIQPEMDESVKKEMYQQAASDWYTINADE